MAANVIPMLSAAAGTANCQPNRIADETMKTEAIETSDLPLSSIGTGLRSAISASAKKTTTTSALEGEGGSRTINARASARIGKATNAVAET
jgi:hypothetical protein